MIKQGAVTSIILEIVLPLVILMGATRQICGQSEKAGAGELTTVSSVDKSAAFSAASPNETLLHVLVNRSLVVDSTQKFTRVYYSDPNIITAYTENPNQVLITAKAPGVSSLVVWDQSGRSQSYIVSSDLDVDGLRSSLREKFPGQDIHVESSGERVLLSGVVGTSSASDAADKLAGLYSKVIINSIVVNSSRLHQIKLKVRVLELDRSRITQLGVNLFSTAGNTMAQTSTMQFPSQLTASNSGSGSGSGSGAGSSIGSKALSITNPLNLILYNSSINLGAMLEDLENKQVLQILAEPTLTTLDGEKASFLSGGEFPFPVVQGTSGGIASISVQFRQFGVKLDFTPKVNIDGTIELVVTPEVSALDYSNAVTIGGYQIPALSTRRAETQVVLRSGQSFAISGLLDQRTTNQFSRMPGFANVPILGELFKSKSIDHARTELVVVATPELVDPTSATEPPSEPNFPVQDLVPNTFDSTLKPGSKK